MMIAHGMTASCPLNKARAYSDDYGVGSLDFDFGPLQRANSSEAKLPSRCDGRDHRAGVGSEDGKDGEDGEDGEDGDDGDDGGGSDSDDRAPAPRHRPPRQRRSFNDSTPKSWRVRPNAHGRSDTLGSGARGLQTIDSGIALAGLAAAQDPSPTVAPGGQPDSTSQRRQQPSARCPRHPLDDRDARSPSPRRSASPTLPPLRPGNGSGGGNGSLPPPTRHTRHDPNEMENQDAMSAQSDCSYYTADAGKHGFLTHCHAADRRGRGGWNDDDSDVGSVGADSANDSLVFKYRSGRETPPADYTLPASIMGVYGVECDGAGSTVRTSENGNKILFDIESCGGVDASCEYETRNDDDSRKGSPPKAPSTMRIRRLSAPPAFRDDVPPPGRIPPYRERKRLMEMELEEEKRREEDVVTRRSSELNGRKRREAMPRSETNGSNGGGLQPGGNPGGDETTPLAGRLGGGADRYGSADNDHGRDRMPGANTKWFSQLRSLVTGEADNEGNLDAAQQESRVLDEAARSYHECGQEFLRRTEERREKLREQSQTEHVRNLSIRGHRATMSYSSALESVVSCSSEDETESSDEESGSSRGYDDDGAPGRRCDDDGAPGRRCDHAAPAAARVWKYGEPPTYLAGTKAEPSGSRRDRVMRRERLLLEEQEHLIHSLERENEKLSKKFRAFVLVVVAAVLSGSLVFAFVVCVRMLI